MTTGERKSGLSVATTERGSSAALRELKTDSHRPAYGEELSEGQWQKVAVSRSRMVDAPLVMLLDEPTAALDPRAEHDLFESFAALTAASRSRGAVTVLVSHRFSTVRMADLIVVLHEGRVVEREATPNWSQRTGGTPRCTRCKPLHSFERRHVPWPPAFLSTAGCVRGRRRGRLKELRSLQVEELGIAALDDVLVDGDGRGGFRCGGHGRSSQSETAVSKEEA